MLFHEGPTFFEFRDLQSGFETIALEQKAWLAAMVKRKSSGGDTGGKAAKSNAKGQQSALIYHDNPWIATLVEWFLDGV